MHKAVWQPLRARSRRWVAATIESGKLADGDEAGFEDAWDNPGDQVIKIVGWRVENKGEVCIGVFVFITRGSAEFDSGTLIPTGTAAAMTDNNCRNVAGDGLPGAVLDICSTDCFQRKSGPFTTVFFSLSDRVGKLPADGVTETISPRVRFLNAESFPWNHARLEFDCAISGAAIDW